VVSLAVVLPQRGACLRLDDDVDEGTAPSPLRHALRSDAQHAGPVHRDQGQVVQRHAAPASVRTALWTDRVQDVAQLHRDHEQVAKQPHTNASAAGLGKPACFAGILEPLQLKKGWCNQEKAQRLCDRLYWCGQEKFIISTVAVGLFWTLSWFFFSTIVFPFTGKVINQKYPSKYENEETPRWFAWHMQSMVLSILVVYWALPGTYRLSLEAPDMQFSRPRPDTVLEHGLLLNDYVAIAQAAHFFFSYIVIDLIICALTRFLMWDILIHHMLFIFFSLAVSFNCFAFYLAGMLLLMEVSTVFLNHFTYFRNRLGYDHWTVQLSFGLFALTFMIFRLAALMWIGGGFIRDLYWRVFSIQEVPDVHLAFICVLLLGAMALQWTWAVQIGSKLVRPTSLLASKPVEKAAEKATGLETLEKLKEVKG